MIQDTSSIIRETVNLDIPWELPLGGQTYLQINGCQIEGQLLF